MNIDKRKNVDLACILAVMIGLIGCIYIIAVSLGSIREARAAGTEIKNLAPETTKGLTASGSEAQNDIEVADEKLSEIDAEAINETESSAIDLELEAKTEPLRKKVVLLDNFDNQFGEVCFVAADEAVFMSYGWAGLAQQALIKLDDERGIDDIKIDLIGNCDDYIGEPINLEYNPAVTVIADEDF